MNRETKRVRRHQILSGPTRPRSHYRGPAADDIDPGRSRVVPALRRRSASLTDRDHIGQLPHPPGDGHAAVVVAGRGVYHDAHLPLPLGQDRRAGPPQSMNR